MEVTDTNMEVTDTNMEVIVTNMEVTDTNIEVTDTNMEVSTYHTCHFASATDSEQGGFHVLQTSVVHVVYMRSYIYTWTATKYYTYRHIHGCF